MFRFFILSFSIFMSVSAQAQQSLDISFSMNDFKVITNDGLSAIITTLKERRVCGDSISPDLPYFFYRIPLQQGQENVSVNVSFTDSLLSENINIVSNPKPSTRNGKSPKEDFNRIATRSVESPLHYSGIKYQNGKGYLLLKITPFLYDAENCRLTFVKNVHLSFSGIPVRQNVNPVSIHEALNTTSLTCELSGVPGDRTDNDTIDYLIITNSTLSSSFNQLAQWKRRKCLRTKIVTLDSIYAQYPQYSDNPSKIKAYILDYASPTRMKWVLLGGDDSIVPAKYCDVHELSAGSITTPSDWYYCCYDDQYSLNWDYNNNEMAGEIADSINYTPCVYLSRLPIRTTQQVSDYTEKLINYENGINVNNNMLLAGYEIIRSINGKSDSHILNEEIFDEFVDSLRNGKLKILFDTGSSYQFTINGDNFKSVIDSLFNVIHEISHGDPNCWNLSTIMSQYYYNSHAASQTNSPGSVIITGACFTNAFDSEPCLSESLIRNPNGGAVSYFGCSREGVGGECTNFSGNYIPIVWSDQYNGHFLQYLFYGTPPNSSHSIAAIATEAKATVYNEFGDEDDAEEPLYHDLLLATNIMGDPEMPVWTDSIQSFTSGNGPTVGPYIIHSMMGGGLNVISPVGGCTIAVLDEHGTRQVAYNTNSATFSGLSGQTYVAIMKHNYIPYLRTTAVSSGGIIGPILHATHSESGFDLYIEDSIEDYDMDESALSSDNWYLTIADLMRGSTKLSLPIVGNSYYVSTIGWTPGVYAIHVVKNGKTASTKIIIK